MTNEVKSKERQAYEHYCQMTGDDVLWSDWSTACKWQRTEVYKHIIALKVIRGSIYNQRDEGFEEALDDILHYLDVRGIDRVK